MALRQVANVGLDGSTVTVTFGKTEIKCVKASYGDKLSKEKLRAMGEQKISEITQGTYDTDETKITMSAVRFRTEFLPKMPKEGGGNVRLALVIGRSHPDLGRDSDMLDGCQCINWGAAVENSAKAEEVELAFITQQIYWTSARKTLNQLTTPIVGAGLSGF